MKRIVLIFLLAICSTVLFSQEENIGETVYDLQTNGSNQNRIYYFEDEYIGTVWTYGMQHTNYPNRGTGYNFNNGDTWLPWPEERIESQRSGWPSYAPLGENGELIVSHLSAADSVGLLFNKRINKGEGDWVESLFQGPTGYEEIFWPRMVTGEDNHTSIFLLALTAQTSHGGDVYQGLNGAVLYSCSTDGGDTWDIHNQILAGMDSTEYHGFKGDCYAFAEPKENFVAFVVGSYTTDLFLMKSTDFGQTFEKTVIWEHPYPFFNPDSTMAIDTFYSVDGSLSVALDMNGKAHVVFGIVSNYYDNDWRFNRMVDGVGYWNEDREPFSSDISALNPEGGPGSEMMPDYNLIGWSQDINGNGQLDFSDIGIHGPFGISSMVQLVIDELDRIFLCYTSITEDYHFYGEHYRRLWFRSSFDDGNTWGQFYHYIPNDSINEMFDFMFPSLAAKADEFIHCIFFTGFEPGIYGYGGSETPELNDVWYAQISKDEIVGIKETTRKKPVIEVFQNYPNPFSKNTSIKVNLYKATNIKLDIFNILGQKVYESEMKQTKPGINNLTISSTDLTPGIYFYTVKAGESSITKKMIVE